MKKNWDIWISLVLLLAGATCLLVSTDIPFIRIENEWVQFIHYVELIFLIFVSVLLFIMFWKRKMSNKKKKKCKACKYPQDGDWRYCPKCGTSVQSD